MSNNNDEFFIFNHVHSITSKYINVWKHLSNIDADIYENKFTS